MDKVYSFTNENVTSYGSLYDFSNAKVLSVLGSGDQYFAGMLYGAKDIDLFDINPLAWDYFVMKFFGIRMLNYEEFYEYFVLRDLNDLETFKKLLLYLPLDVKRRLSEIQKNRNGLSSIITPDSGDNFSINDGHIIPYFNRENYYKLQEILRNKKLPSFYLDDFLDLSDKLSSISYDVILSSNIFYWIYMHDELKEVPEYKKILERFKCPEIQALYYWGITEEIEEVFKNNGFDIEYVNPVSRFSLSSDTVISLRKK